MTVRALVLSAAFVLLACGHKPPYTRANRPTPEQLLQGARPQLDAITVSEATITLDRVYRGDLAMLAQAPSRFRASVTKAGNEVLALAFTENDYALRYVVGNRPPGFYAGPADACAVEAMLGVPLSYEDLVAAVLGGAPVLGDHEVIEQAWDRRHGRERLLIGNDRFIEELHFQWVEGSWRYSGGALWERKGDGRGRWLWSLEHDDFEKVGSALLPGKTEIRSPSGGKSLAIIRYDRRDPSPPWAKESADGGEDGGEDEGGWEGEDDEGGWEGEDDEGGWEGEDEPAAPKSVAAAPAPAEKNANIPEVFHLDGAGLPPRGDLCR